MSAAIYRQKPALKTLSLSSLEYLVVKTIGEEPPSAKKCKLSLRSPNVDGRNLFFSNTSKSQLSGQTQINWAGTSTVERNRKHNITSPNNDELFFRKTNESQLSVHYTTACRLISSQDNKIKSPLPQISLSDFTIPSPLQETESFVFEELDKVQKRTNVVPADDDDVFLERHDNNKENCMKFRSRRQKGSSERRLSIKYKSLVTPSISIYGISPPAPALSIDEAVCVNSPERRKLQEVGLESVNQAVRNSSGFDIKLLGKGGYGTVVLGSWKNMRVAVKVIARDDKMLSEGRRRTSIDSEMNVIRIPEHENIVKVHGIFDGMEALHSSVIVMEYVGHYNLQHVIDSQPYKLQNECFLHCAATEIGRGLNHCHNYGVIHLDLKPSNVLVISSSKPSGSWFDSCSSCSSVNSNDNVSVQFKIGDFGCSKQAKPKSYISTSNESYEPCRALDLSRPLGTPGYQAPEMLNGKGPITNKCDIYSYGILLWQLLTRTGTPYQGIHQHAVIFKVVSQGLRPNYNDTICYNPNIKYESAYRQLFQSCWQQNYYERPSMPHLLGFLRNMKSSSPKASIVSPNIKLGYHTIKHVHRTHRPSASHQGRRNSNMRY